MQFRRRDDKTLADRHGGGGGVGDGFDADWRFGLLIVTEGI